MTTTTDQLPSQPSTMADYEITEQPESADEREQWDRKLLQVEAVIRALPLAQLNSVFDFANYLVSRRPNMGASMSETVGEEVFGRDWNSPEDDEAWGSLTEARLFISPFLLLTSARRSGDQP